MTIQFKNGKILFVDGKIAMDPNCCCGESPICFICGPSTFAIYDTVIFTVSDSSCSLTNGSSSHFNANWCRDITAGGPLTVGSNFFPTCPLGSGSYFFIYDPWTNEVQVRLTIGLTDILIETFTDVCPPNTFVKATSAGFTLTIQFT